MVDVGDLNDGEVAEAEARHARGVERVVGLHRVLEHGDSDGVVHRRGAEAAAEAEAEGLRADAAHGTALPGLPVRRIALAHRRHGWTAGDRGPAVGGLSDGLWGLAEFRVWRKFFSPSIRKCFGFGHGGDVITRF